ncbi:MAG: hypothetical protein KDC71_05100 [Acidobacteria bacterium]|nr:hypothetical protein [Acidobacteriota bacterium]
MLIMLWLVCADWELVLVNGQIERLAEPIEVHAQHICFRNRDGQYFIIAADLVLETRAAADEPLQKPIPEPLAPRFPLPAQAPEVPILVNDKILAHFGQTHRWQAPETQAEQTSAVAKPSDEDPSAAQLLAEQADLNEHLAKQTQPLIARIQKYREQQNKIRKDLRFEQDENKRRSLHQKLKDLQAKINKDHARLVHLQEEGRRKGAKIRDQIDP